HNRKLKGISLEGEILEVSGEHVKLHLSIDENQEVSKAAWFRYLYLTIFQYQHIKYNVLHAILSCKFMIK
ncbi:hypothetical protein, partial [Clostridium butyricum]|uniref:hypothetical protein n=1 Tax=Clostridium butyricum TaxID=1492 RepID=UPI002102914A